MGRQEHRLRFDLFEPPGAHGSGRVHLGHHVRVVDEIAQDRQRPLLRQPQGQVDGILHPKAHPQMFGRPDFHLCSPLSVVSGRGQWSVVSGQW